jgi:hypothetical protein
MARSKTTHLDRTMALRLTSDDRKRLGEIAVRLGLKPTIVARLATLYAIDRVEREGPAFLFENARRGGLPS